MNAKSTNISPLALHRLILFAFISGLKMTRNYRLERLTLYSTYRSVVFLQRRTHRHTALCSISSFSMKRNDKKAHKKEKKVSQETLAS